jgi:signal transduction histidine kinase/CheY-like chemotaxis protein
MAMATDRELEVCRSALQALGTSPHIDSGDLVGFHAQAQEVAQQHGSISIVLADRNALQVVNTLFPPDAPKRTRSMADSVRLIFETALPMYTDLWVGPVTGVPQIGVDTPVVRQGQVIYDLAMNVPASRLDAVLWARGASPDMLTILLDRKGMIVSRQPTIAQRVGMPVINSSLRDAATQGNVEGTLAFTSFDGLDMVAAYSRATVSGLLLTVARPVALFKGEAMRRLAWLSGAAILVLAAGIAVAFFMGRSLVRDARSLNDAADRIATGDFSHRIAAGDSREFADLARAFNDMADRVQDAQDSMLEHTRSLELANRDLTLARQVAEAASRSKSAFLANMSHEIRTPMNSVTGMLQLLQDTRLEPEQEEYAGLALRSSRNLLCLLDDILDLSRIEAGATSIREEPFVLQELIRTVFEALKLQADAKGLRLSAELGRTLPSCLLGDVGRLRQVIFNLVGNAIKYTEQGEVRLELYGLPHSPPGQVCLHLAVSDTGIGIPDEHMVRIFEPFSQIEESYTRRQGGVGLGLSIVKRLVGAMGGTIELDSEPGRGTEVHVSLRLRRMPERPYAPETRLRSPASEPGRVLVVDDDETNRLALSMMLEKRGYAVSRAANGREALDILEREPHGMVFMDVRMPVMSGIEAVERIRAATSGGIDPRVPVVAVTARVMDRDREAFLTAGMDDCLGKPVDFEELFQVLERTLERRNRTVSAPA